MKRNISPRICVLVRYFSSPYQGAPRQALEITKEVSRNGIRAIVLALSFEALGSPLNISKEYVGDIEYHRLSSRYFNKQSISIFVATLYLMWIHKRFDILQIITNHYCYSGYILKKFFKKKFIVVNTSFRGYIVKPGRIMRIKKFALTQSSAFVVKTDKIHEFYKTNRFFESRIVKISNGVDLTNRFELTTLGQRQKAREILGIKEKDKICLFIGNILKEKGIDLLIKQFVTNRGQIGDLKLLLVGNESVDERFTAEVKRQIEQNNLMEKILLMGMSDNIDLFYKAADIFVLPSRREGLPNVVLEAMAAGLPCIVSDLGYTKELFSDNMNGFVFPLNTPDKLMEFLLKLKNDPELGKIVGLNARKTIEKNYSLNFVASKYIELYRELSSI